MFSVIIPTFNRKVLLSRAVQSVLNQSFKQYELIIVDNGSTDDTKAYVKDLIKDSSFKKIKYVFQQNSGSPAGSQGNTGISKSSYDWVAFLDSDDEWLPEKLSRVREAILNVSPEYGAIAHWEFKISEKKKGLSKLGQRNVKNQYQDLLFGGNKYSRFNNDRKKRCVGKNRWF